MARVRATQARRRATTAVLVALAPVAGYLAVALVLSLLGAVEPLVVQIATGDRPAGTTPVFGPTVAALLRISGAVVATLLLVQHRSPARPPIVDLVSGDER